MDNFIIIFQEKELLKTIFYIRDFMGSIYLYYPGNYYGADTGN